MKERQVFSTEYIIEPQYKKRWFRKGKTVYNLIKIEKGRKWLDPSYGNGWGNFIAFKSAIKVGEFDSFESAETIKKQLTNGK